MVECPLLETTVMAKPEFIRAHKGWLQTAFLSLRKDQREVAILATVDVAPEDYFKRIADQIKRREKRGFAIVYGSGVKADQPTTSHRAMIDALREQGYVYLRDAIPTEDYWVNAGQVDEPEAADLRAADEKIGGDIPADAEVMAASLRSGDLPNPLHDLTPPRPSKSVEEQNARAVEVIRQQAEHYHVYAFLGANRIGAIVDYLTAESFALRDTHWMDVMAVEKGRDKVKPTIDYRRQ